MNTCTLLINWLTFGVITLTLGVMIWYTFETRGLHGAAKDQLDELVRQRRLSVMPTILPEVQYDKGAEVFRLTNIGKGVATNIRIQDVHYSENLPNTYYRFSEVSLIRPDQFAIVAYEEYLHGVKRDPPSGLAQFGVFGASGLILVIRFHDIEGGTYEQRYQMGKDGNKHLSLVSISS